MAPQVVTEGCAAEVVEAVFLAMRCIRAEMRRGHGDLLSVSQFRLLVYLRHHPGASLSEAAEHLGLTLPSASRLVDGLVARELVSRLPRSTDRRRVTLALTGGGGALLEAGQQAVRARFGAVLAGLSSAERETVSEAMEVLRRVLTSAWEEGEGGRCRSGEALVGESAAAGEPARSEGGRCGR